MSIPSGYELILILAVVLLLFGGKKIPELAKGLGQGIKNFKKSMKDDETEVASTDELKKVETTDVKHTTVASNETPKQA